MSSNTQSGVRVASVPARSRPLSASTWRWSSRISSLRSIAMSASLGGYGLKICSNQMRKAWTTEGGDLFLDLTLSSGRRAGLVCALRDAIRSGRLGSGMRLPSSRALAADLGLARGTVVEAYQQLVAAGYLTAERGRGTMVSAGTRDWAASTEPVRSTTPAVSFLPGPPDLASFPRRRWLAALRRALATAPDEAL